MLGIAAEGAGVSSMAIGIGLGAVVSLVPLSSTQSVLSGLGIEPTHRVQLAWPGRGLIVPLGHSSHLPGLP